MKYKQIVTGTFLSRPNRFIAHVSIEGREVICHVKNTGRCRELLIPGVTVVLEHHPQAALRGRKTQYDLIAVYKNGRLINIDSQAPNQAAWEWIHTNPQTVLGDYSRIGHIRREVTHGDSRFDLAFTLNSDTRALMEVKGVTLEEEGMVRFPDAPTQRGIKHLQGLIKARREGLEAYMLFVIQMKGVYGFQPNDATHPAFGQVLREAAKEGVHLLAWDCTVTSDRMSLDAPVPILLDEKRRET